MIIFFFNMLISLIIK